MHLQFYHLQQSNNDLFSEFHSNCFFQNILTVFTPTERRMDAGEGLHMPALSSPKQQVIVHLLLTCTKCELNFLVELEVHVINSWYGHLG